MAASLIDTMTEDFDPDQYHDSYREALEAVVRAKVEGNEIVRPAGLDEPAPKSQPADLTEILRASVAAVKSARGPGDGQAEQAEQAEEAKEDKPKPAKPRTRRKASA
jgi:DNA end-binding protein Ku